MGRVESVCAEMYKHNIFFLPLIVFTGDRYCRSVGDLQSSEIIEIVMYVIVRTSGFGVSPPSILLLTAPPSPRNLTAPETKGLDESKPHFFTQQLPLVKTMAEVADSGPVEPQARHIVYCGVCTLPPEYCEFGGTAKKCEEWLKDHHDDLWSQLYADDALNANLSTLSVSAQERAAKDAAKKEAKAAQNEARDAERKAASKIQIKRVERNKRKYVTVIIGLEIFGLENKKLAKELGKKFATGSSVTRSPAGTEEITVQGDVSEDVKEWLLEIYGSKVPESNIELIEDKKKKKAEA